MAAERFSKGLKRLTILGDAMPPSTESFSPDGITSPRNPSRSLSAPINTSGTTSKLQRGFTLGSIASSVASSENRQSDSGTSGPSRLQRGFTLGNCSVASASSAPSDSVRSGPTSILKRASTAPSLDGEDISYQNSMRRAGSSSLGSESSRLLSRGNSSVSQMTGVTHGSGSSIWEGFQFQQELRKQYLMCDAHVYRDSKFGPHFIYILENVVRCLTLVDFVFLAVSVEARSLGDDVNMSEEAETYTGPLTLDRCPLWLVVIHAGALAVFLLETIFRMWLVGGCTTKLAPHSLFDGFLLFLSLVLSCIFGFSSRWALLPRLFRVFRILHRGSLIKQPRFLKHVLLLSGVMIRSARMLICGFVLLLVNMIIFSVIAMDFLHTSINESMKDEAATERFGSQTVDNCRRAFSSLVSTMGTLYALSIGDMWNDIAMPIIWSRPDLLVFFISYVFLSSVVVLGAVYAAMHESFKEVRQSLFLVGDDYRHSRRTEAMQRLSILFEEIDSDNSGSVSWQEFYHSRRSNEAFIRVLSDLDINIQDLDSVWEVLDKDGDGEVSKEEFMDTMWQLQSGEHKWVMMHTSHKVNKVYTRLEQQQKQLEQGFSTLQSTLTEKIDSLQNGGACSLPNSRFSSKKKARNVNSERFHSNSTDRGTENTDIHVNVKDANENLSSNNIDIQSPKQIPEEDNESEDESPSPIKIDNLDEAEKDRLAVQHMCGVFVEAVANFARQDVVDFWSSNGSTSFIDPASDRVSKRCHRCDYFVSHCWDSPPDWHDVFSRNTTETYGYKKAVELNNTLRAVELEKDIPGKRAESKKSSMGSLPATTTLWLDKCCIPQNDEKEMLLRIQLIEGFIKLSDGLIVLLSWNYFTRLWCIYEWACFLWLHHPRNVRIGCDAFLKESPQETLPLFIHSIESISVVRAQCRHESDHAVLQEKVFRYYQGSTREESFASFERFAKGTAICFMAKEIMLWRTRNLAEEDAWLGPLKDLAAKLGFGDLLVVFDEATPAKWWSQCHRDRLFRRIVQSWFEKVAVRYLLRERRRAVRTRWQVRDIDIQRRNSMGSCDGEDPPEFGKFKSFASSNGEMSPSSAFNVSKKPSLTKSKSVEWGGNRKLQAIDIQTVCSVDSIHSSVESAVESAASEVPLRTLLAERPAPTQRLGQVDGTSNGTFPSERLSSAERLSSTERLSSNNSGPTPSVLNEFQSDEASPKQIALHQQSADAVAPEPPQTSLAGKLQNSDAVEEYAVAIEGLSLIENDIKCTIPAHLQIDGLAIAQKPGAQKQTKTLAEAALTLYTPNLTSTTPRTLRRVLARQLEEQHARTEEQALQLKQIIDGHRFPPRSLDTEEHEASTASSSNNNASTASSSNNIKI